ncbi:hypothetical protein [Pseudoalteromonas phage AL]|nr:hypothetical protein [Pseudoalteromonas phage AL]
MNLVGYTATALSRNDIEDTPTNKNVVDFAIVELKDLQGNLVVMYDDAEGLNPETQKTCDTNGQVTFFAEIGDYDLEINGKAQRINLAANIADYIKLETGESVQEFADSFALKIFQSPTDGGLTEIQTRTVNGGEVYEVRKTSDNTLATIYSDKDSVNEIVQDGTANVSNGDAESVFYIGDGDYTVTINAAVSSFIVTTGVVNFSDVTEMELNNGGSIHSIGQKVSTGLTTWKVTDKNIGLAVSNTAPQLYATPLNGIFIDDCGAVADALYYRTNAWYSDDAGAILATDNTNAFLKAMDATGGIDSKGTINFGYGGYLIDPSVIDLDGIDIRRKTLRGKGPENTTVAQAGLNTYQTFFRNAPRNLSEAGTWGSGGTFNIFDIYVRGNWDGASGQTFVPTESGSGNGITGILEDDYDFDTQGGVIQMISQTRAFFDNVWVSHGYGHNIKYYRGGYGQLKNGRSFATRGSGCWILCPSASDSFTSTPIHNMRFETCRGQFGGLFINHMWGNSITDCLFEGQPRGIYLEEGGDIDTSGSYMEGHYFNDDFYIDGKCWGITDVCNYAFNQADPRAKHYKGLLHYRRDSGFHLDTDNSTYGTRPASINNHFLQRDCRGIGVQPVAIGHQVVVDHVRRQIAAGGGAGSLGGWSAIRHDHNETDNRGAAEIRFKRNLSNDSRSGFGFATTDNGVDLVERWEIDSAGNLKPSSDNTVNIGSASNRVVQIFAILPTHADEASATSAGLSTGQMYKTSTGELRIKL